MERDIRLLRPDDIEVRIQSVNKGGARLLLYKNARVDMSILDETFGPMNWQRHHELIDGQLFCTIEIWDESKQQWISKQDVGVESYTEKEKGRSSDSFKRAAFNVGVGRELYTAPEIFIFKNDLKTFKEFRSGADKINISCFDRFTVTDISYDGHKIATVTIRNENNGKLQTFGDSQNKLAQAHTPPENTVSQANIETLKKAAEKKGVNISVVLAMAGLESLEGITPSEYNDAVAVIRSL